MIGRTTDTKVGLLVSLRLRAFSCTFLQWYPICLATTDGEFMVGGGGGKRLEACEGKLLFRGLLENNTDCDWTLGLSSLICEGLQELRILHLRLALSGLIGLASLRAEEQLNTQSMICRLGRRIKFKVVLTVLV